MNFMDKLSGGGDDARGDGVCGRGEELVAYLYGEAGPAETESFGRHLSACAHCRAEFDSFAGVRAGIVEWRREVMTTAPSIDFTPAPALATETSLRAARGRPSLAALREFFSLSPLWLRAGGLAATLAVCALAALVFARTEVRWDDKGFALSMGVAERRVEVPAPGTFTREQVEEAAARRVEAALSEQERSFKAREEQILAAAADEARKLRAATPVAVSAERTPRRAQAATPPRRSQRQNNLASVQGTDDDELPGLYNLLREAN
jgi:hypothetical protein